jgi:prepilin-type N-terminal cleavage/methylation domain-containing protein/prepilin-type processing-associated H-X9-DG protein
MKKRAKLDGFTLVELLVVMAIIGVLVAMLLPSLRQARENALRVVCASQQRQLVVGVQTYGDDNRRQFWAPWLPYDPGYADPRFQPGGYVVTSWNGSYGWMPGTGYLVNDQSVWQVGYSNYLGKSGNEGPKVSIDPGSTYFRGSDTWGNTWDWEIIMKRHSTYRYFVNNGGPGGDVNPGADYWYDIDAAARVKYVPYALNQRNDKRGRQDLLAVSECQTVMDGLQIWRLTSHFMPRGGGGKWRDIKGTSGYNGLNVAMADGHVKWVTLDDMVPVGVEETHPGLFEASIYGGGVLQVIAGEYHTSPYWWQSFHDVGAWGP